MGVVPKDYVLPADQLARPFLWVTQPVRLAHMPDVSNEALELVFGPGESRSLKSWGHDDKKVHWLATRSGTVMHRDPAYSRYTHHLILRNDGWRTRGLDDTERYPQFMPGMMTCLDTWSPHQVLPDERFGVKAPLYKVQIAVDRDAPLTPEESWALLSPWLRRNPAQDAHLLKRGAAPR